MPDSWARVSRRSKRRVSSTELPPPRRVVAPKVAAKVAAKVDPRPRPGLKAAPNDAPKATPAPEPRTTPSTIKQNQTGPSPEFLTEDRIVIPRLQLDKPAYPLAPRDAELVEDHHGVEVADPYRCLEDPKAAVTKRFVDDQNAFYGEVTAPLNSLRDQITTKMCVTFRLNFHHFDRFELDLRGHTQVRGAAFSCPRLELGDMVLI